MKIALLGSVCKDSIEINGKKHTNMGGPPYYTGYALKYLGADQHLFITYGDEDDEWVKKELKDIPFTHLPSDGTVKMYHYIDQKNPNHRDLKTKYYPNTIKAKYLKGLLDEFDILLIGYVFHDEIADDVFKEFADKTIILANFGILNYAEGDKVVKRNPEAGWPILKYVKYLFMDEHEIKFFAQKENLEEAVKFLQGKGVKNIIATKGSNGSSLFLGDKRYDIKACPTSKVVDPTGAGDTYLAAYVVGMSKFSDPKDIGKFASEIATKCIEKKGAL